MSNVTGYEDTGHIKDRVCDSPSGTGLSREESVSIRRKRGHFIVRGPDEELFGSFSYTSASGSKRGALNRARARVLKLATEKVKARIDQVIYP